MGGREVSRPYRFGFSPKARGFLSFWRCHITNDRCEALASLKGCFLCFCFSPPVSPQFNSSEVGKFTSANVGGDGAIGDLAHSRRLLITFSVIYKI